MEREPSRGQYSNLYSKIYALVLSELCTLYILNKSDKSFFIKKKVKPEIAVKITKVNYFSNVETSIREILQFD